MHTMPTVALTTLGCKLNFAETSTLGRQFLERGYSVVEFGRPADVAVINTCSVTERADRECRQLIRRARRASPDAVVVVTGCYAQLDPAAVSAIEGVDVVLGTAEKFSLFDLVGPLEKQLYPHVFVGPVTEAGNFGPAASTEAADRTRAFLKVQDGCDFSCSFCTIPLARGASRSQSVDACVRQARELTEAGYREIVLTGVNVGDYGRKDGTDLLALLRSLADVEGLDRLRISSIEPNLLTDAIIDFVASHPVMCNHFHIPLQSGADEVLRGMRRRYTAAQYASRVAAVRKRLPECGIGVDVIVGFPGETEQEFEATHRFLVDLPISYLHVFTYSERRNTPAASRPMRVEPKERFRRSQVLRQLGEKKKRAFHERMVGRVLTVLFETDEGDGCRCGFTDNYVRVGVPAGEAAGNTIVPVAITGVAGGRCDAHVLKDVES
jgi:threonylcarbamoyladenosine tRNA methylthiotransferase MtaB